MTRDDAPDGAALPAGHVTRGRGPAHLDLGAAVLTKASVSEQDDNCYEVTCRRTGQQLLVDAADDATVVLATLSEAAAAAGTTGALRGVVTTHGHWDHHRALPEVLAATGAPSLVGRDDAADLPVACDRHR